MNLNYNDEINFFSWKNKIFKILGPEVINGSYDWMKAKKYTNSFNKNATERKPSDI